MPRPDLRVKNLGVVDYDTAFTAMQRFTDARGPESADELWCLQHSPVFTLGLNGDPQHVKHAGDIPVVQADRGGQVTYHGPGQLVVYVLLDVRRARLSIRDLVCSLETAVIRTLHGYGIHAEARRDAPGVYVGGEKIASLGLRIKKGSSYHGLALNVAMDLEPFNRINPCGFSDLRVTQIRDHGGPADVGTVSADLCPQLIEQLTKS